MLQLRDTFQRLISVVLILLYIKPCFLFKDKAYILESIYKEEYLLLMIWVWAKLSKLLLLLITTFQIGHYSFLPPPQ